MAESAEMSESPRSGDNRVRVSWDLFYLVGDVARLTKEKPGDVIDRSPLAGWLVDELERIASEHGQASESTRSLLGDWRARLRTRDSAP